MESNLQKNRTDLKARSLEFSISLVHFLQSLGNNFIAIVLAKQLLRSGTSIGANISEAFGSGSRRDFCNYYTIAYKSAKETKYWIEILIRTHIGNQPELQRLARELEEITKMLAASLRTLKGK